MILKDSATERCHCRHGKFRRIHVEQANTADCVSSKRKKYRKKVKPKMNPKNDDRNRMRQNWQFEWMHAMPMDTGNTYQYFSNDMNIEQVSCHHVCFSSLRIDNMFKWIFFFITGKFNFRCNGSQWIFFPYASVAAIDTYYIRSVLNLIQSGYLVIRGNFEFWSNKKKENIWKWMVRLRWM